MRRAGTLITATVLLAAVGCGDEGDPAAGTGTIATTAATAEASTTEGVATSRPTTTEETPPPTTEAPTLAVEALGRTWTVPAAACGEDPAALAAALDEAARAVERLAGRHASGWPTTTAAYPEDLEQFEIDIAVAGTAAMALAIRAGDLDGLTARWDAYEQSYADEDAGWGGIWVISSRSPEWPADAGILAAAIEETCE